MEPDIDTIVENYWEKYRDEQYARNRHPSMSDFWVWYGELADE